MRHTGRLYQSFEGRVEYHVDSLHSQKDTTRFRLTWMTRGAHVDANGDTLHIETRKMSQCMIFGSADGTSEFRSDSSWAVPVFATGLNLDNGWRKAVYRGDTLLFNRIETRPPCISSSSEFLQGIGLIAERKNLACGMTSENSSWSLLEFNGIPFDRYQLIEIESSSLLWSQHLIGKKRQWLNSAAGRNIYRPDGRSIPTRREPGSRPSRNGVRPKFAR